MAIWRTHGRHPRPEVAQCPSNERAFRWRFHLDASASGKRGFAIIGWKIASVMKTLVTGATGFLGSHVARALAGRGENVRVLVRPSSDLRALDGLEAERYTGDLRDRASLDRAMEGVRRVFHVAADYRLWARNPREI